MLGRPAERATKQERVCVVRPYRGRAARAGSPRDVAIRRRQDSKRRKERHMRLSTIGGKVRLIATVRTVTLVVAMLVPAWGFANHIKSPGTWTPPCGTPGGLACMLEGREGFAMTHVDNELILTHGFKSGFGDSNDTRIYDIDTDTWFDPAPVPPFAIRSEL